MKRIHFLFLPLLLGACSSTPKFSEPTAAWQSRTGQLQYVMPERSIIGEFAVSHSDGDFRLDFTKGGSVPLMRVARHAEFARAEGPLARGRWSGRAAQAPVALHGWVQEVPRVLTAMRGGRRVEIAGGRPGERFVFIFNR